MWSLSFKRISKYSYNRILLRNISYFEKKENNKKSIELLPEYIEKNKQNPSKEISTEINQAILNIFQNKKEDQKHTFILPSPSFGNNPF